MDELLTPVRTTYLRRKTDDEPLLVQVRSSAATRKTTASIKDSPTSRIESADDALSVLKSQPDYDSLSAALRFLTNKQDSSTFNIHVPSPKSAAIAHVLVTEIATNYWTLLREASSTEEAAASAGQNLDADRLIHSLQSVSGVNAVVGHVKALLFESKTGKQDPRRSHVQLHLGIFLHLLAALLEGGNAIRQIWRSSTSYLVDAASRKVQTNSLISLVTSGKILSLAAETSGVIGEDEVPHSARWLTDGVDYSRWIAQNLVEWEKVYPGDDLELQFCFDLFQRSLSLGYAGMSFSQVVGEAT